MSYDKEYSAEYRSKNRERINSLKRNYPKQRREAWLKENGPCIKCGSFDRLEVDHIDPTTKESNIIWQWAVERRKKELLKCQVLCFLCHRLKTNEERGWSLHGEVSYIRGCRCKKCVYDHEKLVRRRLYFRQRNEDGIDMVDP